MTAIDRLRAAGVAGAPVGASPHLPPCTCGEAHPHLIARRTLACGARVRVSSDGQISHDCVGWPRVLGLGDPHSAYTRGRRARAVRAVLDDLSLFSLAELPRVVRLAESTYRYTWSSEDDRRAWIRVHAAATDGAA